jgi:hypothetical protein
MRCVPIARPAHQLVALPASVSECQPIADCNGTEVRIWGNGLGARLSPAGKGVSTEVKDHVTTGEDISRELASAVVKQSAWISESVIIACIYDW